MSYDDERMQMIKSFSINNPEIYNDICSTYNLVEAQIVVKANVTVRSDTNGQ